MKPEAQGKVLPGTLERRYAASHVQAAYNVVVSSIPCLAIYCRTFLLLFELVASRTLDRSIFIGRYRPTLRELEVASLWLLLSVGGHIRFANHLENLAAYSVWRADVCAMWRSD